MISQGGEKKVQFSLSQVGRLMWPLFTPHRSWLWVVLFATPLGVLGQTLQPLILQQTIDGPLTDSNLAGLLEHCALFFTVVIGAFIFSSLGVYALQLIGLRSLAALRKQLFTHILGQGRSFFDVRTTGALMTRTTNDVDAIGESLTRGVVGLISDALIILGTFTMMLWLNPWLTLISFSISPILFWTVNLCRKQLRNLFTSIRESLSSLNGLFAEYINGADETQRYGAQMAAHQRFDRYSSSFRDLYHRANWWDAGLYAVMDGLSALSVGLVIAFVAYQAEEWTGAGLMEGVTVGVLVAFIDALNRIYIPIREFSGRLASIQRALAALDRILALLEVHEEIKSGDIRLQETRGEVSFREVSFKYGNDTPSVLSRINFTVKPGEVVALVGSTGSGKSTIARLLSKQYEGFDGEILLDGIPITQLDSETINSNMVMVGQDPYLFKATIRENIHLWDENLTCQPEQVEAAAKRACAHDFITALAHGYDTPCSAQGADLSAGQRQLITIARAFARPSPIVILDEATASVDALTERLIDQATALLFEERTVLVIAHRLSTIAKADRIIMLAGGKIIEEGTHHELLALGGAYSELVSSELED